MWDFILRKDQTQGASGVSPTSTKEAAQKKPDATITLATIARGLAGPSGTAEEIVRYGADHTNDPLKIRPAKGTEQYLRLEAQINAKSENLKPIYEAMAYSLALPMSTPGLWEGNKMVVQRASQLYVTFGGNNIYIENPGGSECVNITMQELIAKLQPFNNSKEMKHLPEDKEEDKRKSADDSDLAKPLPLSTQTSTDPIVMVASGAAAAGSAEAKSTATTTLTEAEAKSTATPTLTEAEAKSTATTTLTEEEDKAGIITSDQKNSWVLDSFTDEDEEGDQVTLAPAVLQDTLDSLPAETQITEAEAKSTATTTLTEAEDKAGIITSDQKNSWVLDSFTDEDEEGDQVTLAPAVLQDTLDSLPAETQKTAPESQTETEAKTNADSGPATDEVQTLTNGDDVGSV